MSTIIQTNNENAELKKEELSEKIVQKWLKLQKIIKEEITLEDVTINQQKSDYNHLKNYFRDYYLAKLNIRKSFDDIKKLSQNEFKKIKKICIEPDLDNLIPQMTEPVKNLLFLFRNDYNYITKLISLIDENDEEEQIESLVHLFCNQFYDNILIPNPEQTELLLLIYKLLEEEILPMNAALIDDFLNDSSFLGKFCSTFMKRQEFKLYLTMLLNPIILSIENENEECLEMSLISIKDHIIKAYKEKKLDKNSSINSNLDNISTKSSNNIKIKEEIKEEIDFEKILFSDIPKSKVIFKKNIELEAELEEESIRKNNTEMKNENEDENKNKENENVIYNDNYKRELTLENINDIISHEKDPDLKEFYKYQIEHMNDDTDIYSNKGLLEVLNDQCFQNYRKALVKKYKSNFLFIQKKLDLFLQSLIDKISSIPYTVRCICKIIYLLISKKFPLLPKYLRNSFVGKFIFEKSIFPVLNLENKNIIENKIFGNGTKDCLHEIVTILDNTNKCLLFNSATDTEKTIFNHYLMEIVPILNKFFDKLIDVKLPKILDDMIENGQMKIEENIKDKMYNFQEKDMINAENKEKIKVQDNQKDSINKDKKDDIIKKESQKNIYDYFKENSDEILRLQCICFSMQDIIFIINLINKNKKIFTNLDRYTFFSKTVDIIHADEYKLDREISKDPGTIKFFLVFQDEKNSQLEKLMMQKNKMDNYFEAGSESELICKRIKVCLKTILKGLNLLNNKDFTYLNMAISSDKFFTALKYILEDLGELEEMKYKIPLKWYGQFISNNKNQLNQSYKENDFELLYDEIFNEESNILNELKLFSSIVITRDGMNLRCAEKILEKIKYDLKHIQGSIKFLKIEKFVNTEEIEVCIRTKEMEEYKERNRKDKVVKKKDEKNNNISPSIIIADGIKCEHKIINEPLINFGQNILNINNNNNENKEEKNKNKKIPSHAYYINDFINKFANNSVTKNKTVKFKSLSNLVKEDILRGNRNNKIYESFDNYINIIKSKIKNTEKNKELFENITDKQIDEMALKIEDHILRNIYKYVYLDKPIENDQKFYEKTLCLDWIQPEQLEIKKVYINQLGYAELCIKKITEAKSVFDKLDCIKDAHTNMNNTIKFSSGKNDDAGQDELTPIFQYIVIRAQPKRIYSDINYIKCFLGDSSLRGQEGFLVTQMESATSFISLIDHTQLKMSKEEYDKKVLDAKKRHGIK